MARQNHSYTKTVDLGWNRVKRNIEEFDHYQVEVGIFKDAGESEDGMHVAGYAYINEFGEGVPPRPFMQQSIDKNKAKWQKSFKNRLKRFLTGHRSFKSVFNAVGEKAAKDIKSTIETFNDPSNRPSTVRIKGFDNPLVQTGRLKNSIKSKVKKKHHRK